MGMYVYRKSLVPKCDELHKRSLFSEKYAISAGLFCRVFSIFFFNCDKRQSPFFAECDKSAQPITAHHATNCSLASYSHLKISSSTLYFVIKKQTKLGLHDKSHVIAMHISAVKPVL